MKPLVFTLILVAACIAASVALQSFLARQIQRQHGNKYSYWFIFRRIGDPRHWGIVLQPHEQLETALRQDLERAQIKLFLWSIAFSAIALAILVWRVLSVVGD